MLSTLSTLSKYAKYAKYTKYAKYRTKYPRTFGAGDLAISEKRDVWRGYGYDSYRTHKSNPECRNQQEEIIKKLAKRRKQLPVFNVFNMLTRLQKQLQLQKKLRENEDHEERMPGEPLQHFWIRIKRLQALQEVDMLAEEAKSAENDSKEAVQLVHARHRQEVLNRMVLNDHGSYNE